MRVLLIGENIHKSRSGVVTVLKQILKDNFSLGEVTFKTVFTTGDEFSNLEKCFGWTKAYLKYLYYLPTQDIIHVHHASHFNFWLTGIFVRITKLCNKKIILHNHAADFHEFYDNCSSKKKKRIIKIFEKADINIVLSKSWLEWYFAIAPTANWVLLRNAIEIPPKQEVKSISTGSVNLVYLARIEARKGFFDMMNILPDLIKQYPRCRVLIAGQGNTEESEAAVDRLNLGKHITFMGYVSGEQRNALFQTCNILLLPSYNEGLPMSLLEAMSFGAVPITTNVGGIPEVVTDNENGI